MLSTDASAELSRIVRIVDRFVGENLMRDSYAIHEFQSHIENLRSKQGVAFDISLDPAVNHGLETGAGAIHRYDLEIARFDTCFCKTGMAPMAISSFWMNMPWKSVPALYFFKKACTTGTASARVKSPVCESKILMLELSVSRIPCERPSAALGAGGPGDFKDCTTIGQKLIELLGQHVDLPVPYRNQCARPIGLDRPSHRGRR